MQEISIKDRKIGNSHPVYFIAEAGVNHEGNMNLFNALCEVAVWAKVEALKIQTFKADLIVTKTANKAEYQQKNLLNKDSQYEMLKKLEITEKDHEKIKKTCDEKGINFLSTPHSGKWSIDYLDNLGVSAYKIASSDIDNIPHIKNIAKKGRPIFLSTGTATLEEVRKAISTIKSEGNNKIVLLHCTSNYPCPLNEVNLNAMLTMQKEFDLIIGYSDHTNGIEVPIMATALGAKIIEKHFTIDKKMKGNSPDHSSSLTPSEIKEVVEAIKFTEESEIKDPIEAVKNYKRTIYNTELSDNELKNLKSALGDGIKRPTQSELKILKNIRKSVVAKRDILKGEKLTEDNLIIKRPTGGLSPKYYENIINSDTFSTKDISKDEPITGENSTFKI